MIPLRSVVITSIFISFYSATCSQTTINDSIFHQGDYRYYTTYTPSGFNVSVELPVVFVLHGGGGDMSGAMAFDFQNIADTANFIIVFPQGKKAPGPGYGWADGRGSPMDTMGINDVDFFDVLIDTLKTGYNINLSRVYFTGMSNGGFMTQRLACELTDHIAAVSSVASTIDTSIVSSCLPSKAIPVMLISGTLDPIVPYAGGDMGSNHGYIISADSIVNYWRGINNCTTQIDSFAFPNVNASDSSNVISYTNEVCDCNTQVKFLKVIGGGHTWPGYPQPFLEWYLGKVNKDIDAEVEIWRFFREFTNTCFSTSVFDSEAENNTVLIYPNPTNKNIHIKNIPRGSWVKLADITGKELYSEQKLADFIITVDLEKYTPGIYILTVSDLDKKLRYKIVKQ